jgi:putative ABC transport system permease protein
MLKNYFNIAVRALLKNKLYSFINIAGLSAGICVSILILIFVAHEFSFDRFHKNGDRIYRAEKTFSRDGRHSLYANPQFGPAMKEIDPHVVNYVRLYEPGRKVVKSDDGHRFFEEQFIFADTSYFSVFSFELIKGERNALARPNTVIISENMAAKYFGNKEAMGKEIVYDGNYVFEVVGVMKNAPSNSSLRFDFIGSFSSLLAMPAEREMVLNNSSGFPTYLLLSNRNDLPAVQKSILKTTYTNASIAYSLAPLFENHFNLNFGDTANTRYVYIFLCAALLILALAIINYMNLTTARATARAREVGIRKVVGAHQKNLSAQFYIESAITTAISFVVALVLVELFKPLFLNVLQISVDESFLRSPLFIALVAVLLVICILLSGSYPALVLSGFKPVEVLKGKLSHSGQGGWVRKTLTVFQFAVSVTLIICTLVMSHQLDYLRSKKIGLHREQVMVVPVAPSAAGSFRALKNEMRQQSGVTGVAAASIPLFRTTMSGVSLVKSPVTDEQVGTKWIIADKDFPDVLGITWKEKPESDLAGNHIINETAAQAFGLGDKQTGFDLSMGDNHTGVMQGKILGVVGDFNYQSLRAKIEPLIFTIVADTVASIPGDGTLYIRLDAASKLDEKIASIGKIYEKYASETPFTYYFLDDAFNELQKGEERLGKIFSVFTSIALIIACMGLVGLITFTAERRTKEISIRKILGASIGNILSMLSGELMILVLIGILAGSPVAWFVMRDWLSNFFYQADIPSAFIMIPCAAVLLLALGIVWIHGIRTALENPAKNLRNE